VPLGGELPGAECTVSRSVGQRHRGPLRQRPWRLQAEADAAPVTSATWFSRYVHGELRDRSEGLGDYVGAFRNVLGEGIAEKTLAADIEGQMRIASEAAAASTVIHARLSAGKLSRLSLAISALTVTRLRSSARSGAATDRGQQSVVYCTTPESRAELSLDERGALRSAASLSAAGVTATPGSDRRDVARRKTSLATATADIALPSRRRSRCVSSPKSRAA